MYLYDASAVLNLSKRGKVKAFLKGCTLDLAMYEALNAIWKECHLLKKVDNETARKLVELLSKLFSTIELHMIRGLEKEVLEMALKEGMSVYDASYICVAMRNGLTLVTDDEKLLSVSKKHVKAVRSREMDSDAE